MNVDSSADEISSNANGLTIINADRNVGDLAPVNVDSNLDGLAMVNVQ